MNTLSLSRRIVAALDPDRTRWPEWHRKIRCPECSSAGPVNKPFYRDGTNMFCATCRWEGSKERLANAVPDLGQPENLHLLLEVVDGLGKIKMRVIICEDGSLRHDVYLYVGDREYNECLSTRSLAILAVVCAALGIEHE